MGDEFPSISKMLSTICNLTPSVEKSFFHLVSNFHKCVLTLDEQQNKVEIHIRSLQSKTDFALRGIQRLTEQLQAGLPPNHQVRATSRSMQIQCYEREVVCKAIYETGQRYYRRIRTLYKEKIVKFEVYSKLLEKVREELNSIEYRMDDILAKWNIKLLSVEIGLARAKIYRLTTIYSPSISEDDSWISFRFDGLTFAPESYEACEFGSCVDEFPGVIHNPNKRQFMKECPQAVASLMIFSELDMPTSRAMPSSSVSQPVCVGRQEPSIGFASRFGIDAELSRPWGLICDKKGNIFVVDRSHHRIVIFSPSGQFIKSFGSLGDGPNQFFTPCGAAIDAEERLIIADKDNHRIKICTLDGEFLMTFGTLGSGPGQFNYPWDLAVNSAGDIIVSDSKNGRIQLFNRNGIFLKMYSFQGEGSPRKTMPRGIAFTPLGDVVLTDFENHCIILVHSSMSKSKKLLETDQYPFLSLQRPQGIVVDDNGNFIVVDCKNKKVRVINHHGTQVWAIDTPTEPQGIALTPNGRIAIACREDNLVCLYSY